MSKMCQKCVKNVSNVKNMSRFNKLFGASILKQTFTSRKGNKVEIIKTKSTGKRLNDVQHTVKINGVVQAETFNHTQLLNSR